jgi:hypothetical protein
VVLNRSERSAVRLASVELRETAAGPAPAFLSETHPEAPRPLALHLAGPGALDRFGGRVEGGPDDLYGLATNLAGYAVHCGASSVVLADDQADRDGRSALDGQAEEDATAPDRLGLILRILARRDLSAMLEVRLDGPMPGLPGADSPEALARGLVRVDRDGRADGASYQPLNPEVRAAMKARVASAIAPRAAHPEPDRTARAARPRGHPAGRPGRGPGRRDLSPLRAGGVPAGPGGQGAGLDLAAPGGSPIAGDSSPGRAARTGWSGGPSRSGRSMPIWPRRWPAPPRGPH